MKLLCGRCIPDESYPGYRVKEYDTQDSSHS